MILKIKFALFKNLTLTLDKIELLTSTVNLQQ